MIEIACKNSPTFTLQVSKSIIQFTLPVSCSAKSKFFQVDSSITSFYRPEIIQDNAIRIESYGFNVEKVQRKFKVRNPGTFQVIQHLEDETKENRKLDEMSKKQVDDYLETRDKIAETHDRISIGEVIQKWFMIGVISVFSIFCFALTCYCCRR